MLRSTRLTPPCRAAFVARVRERYRPQVVLQEPDPTETKTPRASEERRRSCPVA